MALNEITNESDPRSNSRYVRCNPEVHYVSGLAGRCDARSNRFRRAHILVCLDTRKGRSTMHRRHDRLSIRRRRMPSNRCRFAQVSACRPRSAPFQPPWPNRALERDYLCKGVSDRAKIPPVFRAGPIHGPGDNVASVKYEKSSPSRAAEIPRRLSIFGIFISRPDLQDRAP